MAVNVKEEEVRVEYVVVEETVRTSVEGTLQVPNQKPDIQRVLEIGVEQVKLDDMGSDSDLYVEEGGVSFTGGAIEMGVVYVAAEADQPVHFFHDDLELSNIDLDIPELTSDMNVSVKIEVTDISYEVNPPTDTIEVTAILAIEVKATETREIEVITDVTGIKDSLVDKELLKVEDIIDEINQKKIIKDKNLELDNDISRILKVEGGLITTAKAKIVNGAVKVTGRFKAKVMYVADTAADDQPVYIEEGTFDFTQVIDIPQVTNEMKAYADVDLKRWNYSIADTNVANIDAIINIYVKVTAPREVMAVVDVSSDKVKVEEEVIRVEEIVGENQITDTIVQSFTIPDVKPDIQSIVESKGNLLNLDCNVDDGGVTVTGTLQSGVLYQAEDNSAHFVWSTEAQNADQEFTSFVSVGGAKAGMDCYQDVVLQRVKATKQGDRSVKITATISEYVRVSDLKELNIVTDIIAVSPVVDQPDYERPSRIVYVVQPGDTLYKIAARYNTTVDALVEVNDIENPNYIEVGQKIIIPKEIIDQPRG
ncbi:putative glycosyl hydrolase [Halobacteroides halobius DSM 5150]|uniref:Putative glycosyl hydrolase n=1 Tax=Halobacteroides halobius (strain ATCC 35273 / DSM 5150 / MD-1) TaxID=748449 RepID=L0K7K7_HALHC|nr:SPOCS domain-containing protein [Halobacteroides halobius]AGB40108.1 putative glycosyl hydrolase [Halobacteroides halobius DSM 5150]